jgi:RNA polymerase sigma-54 factor
MQTEWGIYSIGHFFSNPISGCNSGNSEFSKAGVKAMIKEIIGKPEKRKSDIEISQILAERGIKIARRTVAKYRSELEKI